MASVPHKASKTMVFTDKVNHDQNNILRAASAEYLIFFFFLALVSSGVPRLRCPHPPLYSGSRHGTHTKSYLLESTTHRLYNLHTSALHTLWPTT